MPKLGMTMREGKVVSWSSPIGGFVAHGKPIVTIESEKAEVEIEAATSGVLRHVYVGAGETVPCGTLLAAITPTMDDPFDVEAFRREHDRPEVEPGEAPQAAPGAARSEPRRDGAPVTPAARALAKQLGVDVARVTGTGPGGRVTKEDVAAFAAGLGGDAAVVLEVLAEGQGDLVVLLPGFGSDVSMFARQVPALAAGHRVLGVNPRGIGRSAAPVEPAYVVADAATDVAELLPEPAHVVGASLGAAVALELALLHPERVRSLALVTPFLSAPPRLLAVVDSWCALASTTSPDVLARALVPWLFSTRTLGDASARERTVRGLGAMLRPAPAATLARQAAGLRAWSGTRGGELARITVPVLVLVAEDDLLTPDANAVAEAIPGTTAVLVAGTGHAALLEAPDEVNAALLRHLG
jgi:pyruvate dehydrogenase E2 component (dihydrolipoamide acetyltransferase)